MLVEAGGCELLMLTDNNGYSCLHSAAQKGDVQVVKLLVDVGGRDLLMLTHDNGYSCLHFATLEGRVESVKVLLEAGGHELLMLTSNKGYSCLHSAALGGHVELTQLLVEAGGHELLMLTLDTRNISCLHMAVEAGHMEVARLLLEAGGDALLNLTTTDARGNAVLRTLHEGKSIDDDTYHKKLDRAHRMEHEQATLGAKSALQKRLAKRLAHQQQQQQQRHAESATGAAAEGGALSPEERQRIADEHASRLLQEEEESKKTTKKAKGKNKKKGKKQAPSAEQVQEDVKCRRMAGETLDPCLMSAAAADRRAVTEKMGSGMCGGAGRGEASFYNLGVAASGLVSPSSPPAAAAGAVAGNEAGCHVPMADTLSGLAAASEPGDKTTLPVTEKMGSGSTRGHGANDKYETASNASSQVPM